MKTVKTAHGVKKIEDWNEDLVPIQLRIILQEHRVALIERLLTGGLAGYVDYKFAVKVEVQQLELIKTSLESLKRRGIDSNVFAPIFDTIARNDSTTVENTLFYREIDATIKETLSQRQLFQERAQLFFQ